MIRIAARSLKQLGCLVTAGVILTGCAGEPPLPDPVIPPAGKERDAWADRAVRANGVHVTGTDTDSLTTVICRLLPERDDMDEFIEEVARIKYVGKAEAGVLITISVYGYCPGFKTKLQKDNFRAPDGKRINLDV